MEIKLTFFFGAWFCLNDLHFALFNDYLPKWSHDCKHFYTSCNTLITPELLAARRMLLEVSFFQQTELTNCDGSSSRLSSPCSAQEAREIYFISDFAQKIE